MILGECFYGGGAVGKVRLYIYFDFLNIGQWGESIVEGGQETTICKLAHDKPITDAATPIIGGNASDASHSILNVPQSLRVC